MPSDSPSQSVSSAISGRRSTIALFIPGIPTNPLRIHSLSSSLPCYWSTCNQYRSKRIVFTKQQALLTSTYSSHQFPSLFLHVKGQECPQTARRNQSHQQSVEGEVQLRFSSQAFQPIHSLSLSLFLSLSLSLFFSFQACHATGLPAIYIALRAFHSQSAKFLVSAQVSKIRKKAIRIQVRTSCFCSCFYGLIDVFLGLHVVFDTHWKSVWSHCRYYKTCTSGDRLCIQNECNIYGAGSTAHQ